MASRTCWGEGGSPPTEGRGVEEVTAPETEIRVDNARVRNRAGVGEEPGGDDSDGVDASKASVSVSTSAGKAHPSPPIGPACRSADGRPLLLPAAAAKGAAAEEATAAAAAADLLGRLASRLCPLAWRVWITTLRLRTSLIWIRQSTTWGGGEGRRMLCWIKIWIRIYI